VKDNSPNRNQRIKSKLQKIKTKTKTTKSNQNKTKAAVRKAEIDLIIAQKAESRKRIESNRLD
jgi:hypothetical protein